MANVKEAAKKLIDHLPDQATWDDVIYEMYVKQKIEAGLQAVHEGRTKRSNANSSAMKVEWSQPAHDDLARIRAFIAADLPRYARQFTERIIGPCASCASFR